MSIAQLLSVFSAGDAMILLLLIVILVLLIRRS